MAAELKEFLMRKPTDLAQARRDLKLHVLNEGIPASIDGQSSLRHIIWSILLNVEPMKTDEYLSLVERGASPAYQKIRHDTFRTLASDPLFKNKVSEISLIRVLNAHAWKAVDGQEIITASRSVSEVPYVQGMNILAAPFLYACRSEAQAFALFEAWITCDIPLYIRSSLLGVHMGVKLVDQTLKQLDAKLYLFLKTKGLSAELYAFPSVMTLSACTPPLSEVLVLWDFLHAYGAHMNILCIVAQLIMIREKLLASLSPMSLLRKLPNLQGERIKQLAISFLPSISEDFYGQLVRHCYDESLAREL